jgi:ribosome biogenesis GTPase
MLLKGQVIKSGKRHFEVKLQNNQIIHAPALATILKIDHVVVGDYVLVGETAKGEWIISEVLTRDSLIFRNLPRERKIKSIASNVTLFIIVVSAGKPEYKRGLVDRYLVRKEEWNIPCIVVFNKMDLFQNEFDLAFEADRLLPLGVECYEISSENSEYKNQFLKLGMGDLEKRIENQTTIVLGHSGVGKSRLISKLSQGKITLLSGDLGSVGKGAHTTSWAELIDCGNFKMIDSPGVRSVSIADIKINNLNDYFPDLHDKFEKCRFPNCSHQENAKDCYFKKLNPNERETELILSRLEAYQRIKSECDQSEAWEKD